MDAVLNQLVFEAFQKLLRPKKLIIKKGKSVCHPFNCLDWLVIWLDFFIFFNFCLVRLLLFSNHIRIVILIHKRWILFFLSLFFRDILKLLCKFLKLLVCKCMCMLCECNLMYIGVGCQSD